MSKKIGSAIIKAVRDYLFPIGEELERKPEQPESEVQETAKKLATDSQDRQLSKRIFIVHGHNKEMRESVARIVEKLGLETVVLDERPNMGRTIIEKFEDHSDVEFAIVCLSPDDIGATDDGEPNSLKKRARQNVVFELGYFTGKLGRGHVSVLFPESDDFEFPSDYLGILYISYDSRGKWKFDLAEELKSVGYEIDANKLYS